MKVLKNIDVVEDICENLKCDINIIKVKVHVPNCKEKKSISIVNIELRI